MSTPYVYPPRIGRLIARVFGVFAPCAAFLALAPFASADSTWNNPTSGTWDDAGNWIGGVPIASGDTKIGNSGTAQLAAGVSGVYESLHVGNGSTVAISGGLLSGTVAYLSDAQSSITVSSGTWQNGDSVFIRDNATLNINGGLVSSRFTWIADGPNPTGSATISSGTWNNSDRLVIGSEGSGTMTVNGGLVSNPLATIGWSGEGTALIAGGTWQTSGTLTVGFGSTGRLIINSGLVTGSTAILTGYPEAEGIATVSGGTWNVSSRLSVGDNGTGSLTVNGGLVTSSTIHIGNSLLRNGSVSVTSGTLHSSSALSIGRFGTGDLAIEGGLVRITGTVVTGQSASGTGTLTVSGNEANRGVLEAIQIREGLGTGTLTINGGIVRALANQSDFLVGYEAGDVRIGAGGAFVDSGSYAIGITAALSGSGALTKQGAGTLTLSGSNTHSGGTVVSSGTIAVNHNNALGTGAVTVNAGTLLVRNTFSVANPVTLAGGTLAKELAAGDSLVNSIRATSSFLGGEADTTANILSGTTSAAATITATFSATSGGTNSELLQSDVLHLSGVPFADGVSGPTDIFVLELLVPSVTPDSYLAWLDDSNEWVNAVLGNTGGTMVFVGDRAYDALTDFHLGYYGVDTANGTVWAVLNHNSDFAIVPEPATASLLALGSVALLARRRRPATAKC